MPRISDDILNCVVYIYPTKTHAERSMGWGGTGFLVSVPAPASVPKIGDLYAGHTYIVSCGHVVAPMGSECWIRLNTHDGGFDCIKTNPTLWSYSEASDIAAIQLPILDINKYDIAAIRTTMFLDKERLASKGVGVGDETFVVGRFINHEGQQRNKPTARFGTIAMMPDAEDGIQNDFVGKKIEAYLVEAHTVGGYSGSPVGFMIPPFSNRPEDRAPSWQWRGPWLLGVDFCHIVTYDDVYEQVNGKAVKTKYQAQTSTGMLAVAPAWELLSLLNEPHFVSEREAIDAQWEAQHARPKV